MTAPPAGDHAVAWRRDPGHLLVAWTITAATRVRLLRGLGARARHARPALRLLADERPAAPVLLAPDDTAAVVAIGPAGRHAVEIGLCTGDGEFVALVCTAPVTTAAPAAEPAVTWVRAPAPTVPVAAAWSGRRVPPVAPDLAGPRSSEPARGR